MDSRREFLKKSALLAGASVSINLLPASIQKALAIHAKEGSTYLDAEHVVFLMQENRSFDHCYGTLKGVRGFNDPRAMKLPNQLPVWVQTNKAGQHFAPFHLDIVNTKSTWMGSLPHGWRDMVGARNDGKMDNWLEAKSPGDKEYKHMPLTMGYYNRADIPFYYAFADAFTVCDQHFCSSLTGTSANRSYFWAGTVRENPRDGESTAHVDNSQINYKNVSWKTYPERLEEAGVTWKVYQNELSLPVGFKGEEEDWLANFTDNNLEFHKQYNVRFHPKHQEWMKQRIVELEKLVVEEEDLTKKEKYAKGLEQLKNDVVIFSAENFNKLSKQEQAIHRNAFVTNTEDADYHRIASLVYDENETKKEVQVPAGDVLYAFRKDVDNDTLPTVSWLAAPCRFSDHPGSPWFGAWYVSEVLDILTKNPEIFKKTIFILTYDENDGYFDHIAPFVPPLTDRPEDGLISDNLDSRDEYVTQEQERKRTKNEKSTLESPIGLGYRVPMVIASPWSKGGWVNSEVFDHTSTLQFLEHFIQKKQDKKVIESNISAWRRMVCGDLTSSFHKISKSNNDTLKPVNRDEYVERVYQARNKELPADFNELGIAEIEEIKASGKYISSKLAQESGTKPSCALPLELQANLIPSNNSFSIESTIDKRIKDSNAVGLPYFVMSYQDYGTQKVGKVWNFSVRKGDRLSYNWDLDRIKEDTFSFALHGPNGFYRFFKAQKNNIPKIEVKSIVKNNKPTLVITKDKSADDLYISDNSYGLFKASKLNKHVFEVDCSKSNGWYDIIFTSDKDQNTKFQYAGRIETGLDSTTDPLMGKVLLEG